MGFIAKWYEKEKLPKRALDELILKGGFRHMQELSPNNSNQLNHIQIDSKIEVLMNNGLSAYYTITNLKDRYGLYVVGRDETGIQEKGMEFRIGSSMCWCYESGYRVLEKFPWE